MTELKSGAVVVGFDEPTECPKCRTSKAAKPTLKLFYSSCCGRVLCTDCVNDMFKRANNIICSICNQKTNRQSYQEENLDAQRYKTEKGNRLRLERLGFRLQRADFPNLEAYNEYLENVQSIVYDLTWGDEEERDQAEKRIPALQKQYRPVIELSTRRIAEEQQRSALKDKDVVMGISNLGISQQLPPPPVPAGGPGPPMFPAPKPLEKKEDAQLAEIEALPPEERAHALAMRAAVLTYYAKIAGGYKEQYDQERNFEEAFLSLF